MFTYFYRIRKLINPQALHKNYSKKSTYINVRHFPPAIREWNNSVYNYNKNNFNYSPVKVNLLDNLLKKYFNLTNRVLLARSKRMRYLRRKSMTRKVFLSSPEIKQSNDKIIVTVYSFDRDRQMLIRKLFYYNRPNLYNRLTKLGKRRLNRIKKRIKYKFPFSYGIKFIKELKLFRNRNYYKNKHLQQAFLIKFIQSMLSLLGIRIFIPIFSPLILMKDETTWRRYSNRKFNMRIREAIINLVNSNPNLLYWVNYEMCSIEKIEKKNIKYNVLMEKYAQQFEWLKKNKLKADKLIIKTEINNKLLKTVSKYLLDKFSFNNISLLRMFNNHYHKYRKFAMLQMYKKRASRILRLLRLFTHNTLRYKTLLPALKKTIDNLYNKKVELNIINLKYIYLNSDILTQFLIFRIKKNINSVRMLKKTKAKIPLPALSNINPLKEAITLRLKNNTNSLRNEELSLKNLIVSQKQQDGSFVLQNNNDTKDILSSLLDRIFPRKMQNKTSNTYRIKKESKVNSILSTIRYKKLLGLWIEAKGRLTRRNTASRSVLNAVFKGNLKDKDRRVNFNYSRSVPTIILRNDLRSNTQYTSKGSVRRIGAFGVKTWLTSK